MIVKANRMICLKSRLNAMQLILDFDDLVQNLRIAGAVKGELLRQSPRLYQENYKAQHTSCFFLTFMRNSIPES